MTEKECILGIMIALMMGILIGANSERWHVYAVLLPLGILAGYTLSRGEIK